jgi:hypothetical protein
MIYLVKLILLVCDVIGEIGRDDNWMARYKHLSRSMYFLSFTMLLCSVVVLMLKGPDDKLALIPI